MVEPKNGAVVRHTVGYRRYAGLEAAAALAQFLSGLRTAWQEGEVRPTSRPTEKAKRGRRRPSPFVAVTAWQ